jgi:hypothetical protein
MQCASFWGTLSLDGKAKTIKGCGWGWGCQIAILPWFSSFFFVLFGRQRFHYVGHVGLLSAGITDIHHHARLKLPFFFFFLVEWSGVWTQGFMLTKQEKAGAPPLEPCLQYKTSIFWYHYLLQSLSKMYNYQISEMEKYIAISIAI